MNTAIISQFLNIYHISIEHMKPHQALQECCTELVRLLIGIK